MNPERVFLEEEILIASEEKSVLLRAFKRGAHFLRQYSDEKVAKHFRNGLLLILQ